MPKIIDHDARREHIVDVTWDLIIQGGIEAATMREIASASGFANGALKHYFDCKADIVDAAFQRALRRMQAYVSLGDRRGMDALREICESAMPRDEDRIKAGRVLLTFWYMSLSNPKMAERYRDHLRDWRAQLHRFIAEARQDGDIRTSVPDEQLVDQVVLLTAGANVMTLVGPEFSTVELQQSHLDLFFDRLAQP